MFFELSTRLTQREQQMHRDNIYYILLNNIAEFLVFAREILLLPDQINLNYNSDKIKQECKLEQGN